MSLLKIVIIKIIKSISFWIILFEISIALFLYNRGFRITYYPKLENSWDAIGAVGQWAGALVGILIPIVAVYLQSSLDKSKQDIGESNQQLLKEFEEFKNNYSEKLKILSQLVDEYGDVIIDGGNFCDNNYSNEDLKEKALRFINISMITNTKDVAEHLGIDDIKAYNLLVEMLRHDGLISSAGFISEGNMQNIVWTKKKR